MSELFRRFGKGITWSAILLSAFWILLLGALPYSIMFESSFRPYLPAADVGGPLDTYSLNNYLAIFSNVDWNFFKFQFPMTIHLWVFFLTIFWSSVATLITLAMCYPLAYFMAKVISPKGLATFFLFLIIPLWVSELLRAFALFNVLAMKGPLSLSLVALGVIDKPIRWTWGLWGYSGVIIGLTYVYCLFMLLPIYNAMTSLDTNQIEAAEDLGAKWWQIHRRVIIPHSKPGIASGCVTVFMLCVGSILIPTLLNSPSSTWFTEVIDNRMFDQNDWNGGAAYAFMLLVICIVFVTAMMRLFRVGLSDIAK